MPKQKFFLVVPPGFEDLALRELQWRGFLAPVVTRVKGGLEFECALGEGLALNQLSRLGVRVLLRLAEFRCRDFPKLFNRVREMKWAEYVRGPFEVEVSASKSRLMNKKRIASTVSEAVEKSLRGKRSSSAAGVVPTQIFVRFADDVCTVSLDTSGEALFKRGYKVLEALAPLRENFAAGLFFSLYERAGWPSTFELVDPLCGSGTFLSEAGLFAEGAPTRKFDFQKWFENELVLPSGVPNLNCSLYGFDRHPDALKLAEENLRQANIKAVVEQKDFLQEPLILPASGPAKRLGISNPPYGVRIKLPVPPAEFYTRLVGAFEGLGCNTFGFIVPRGHLKHLPKSQGRLDFSNGGIDVSLVNW